MIKKLRVLALAAAFAAPLSTAHAVGNTSYNVCGGSYSSWQGFAFCASVQISVVQRSSSVWNVAIQVANMSGLNGSYAGSVFSQIGIDNIVGNLASPANITVSQGGKTVCSNPTNSQTDYDCWKVSQDANATGGFNVDFLDQSTTGLIRDISSLCSNDQLLLYTCLAAQPVTLAFDINHDWNPATTGQVYIQAVSVLGYDECETGSSVTRAERCMAATFATQQPPVTATPEPATVGLMASGLLSLGPVAAFRRRKRKPDADQTDA